MARIGIRRNLQTMAKVIESKWARQSVLFYFLKIFILCIWWSLKILCTIIISLSWRFSYHVFLMVIYHCRYKVLRKSRIFTRNFCTFWLFSIITIIIVIIIIVFLIFAIPAMLNILSPIFLDRLEFFSWNIYIDTIVLDQMLFKTSGGFYSLCSLLDPAVGSRYPNVSAIHLLKHACNKPSCHLFEFVQVTLPFMRFPAPVPHVSSITSNLF